MLGVAGLLGFVVYSVYWSPEPLIRRSLFNSPTAITAYASTFIHGVMVWSLLFYCRYQGRPIPVEQLLITVFP